jgi:ABC-type antimicrobial peptide transport system ATPase subunit
MTDLPETSLIRSTEAVELLRRAAADAREQHGPAHARHEFWCRLSNWWDKTAWMIEMDADLLHRIGCDEAVAAARAYLGRPAS